MVGSYRNIGNFTLPTTKSKFDKVLRVVSTMSAQRVLDLQLREQTPAGSISWKITQLRKFTPKLMGSASGLQLSHWLKLGGLTM